MSRDPTASLLRSPTFTAQRPSGERSQLDLAEVLEALSRGEALEFPALQSHQQQPWHAFLVQLAAMALSRAGQRQASEPDAATWRGWVGALADEPEAFCLVVDDLLKPAFFQPPVPEGHLQTFKRSSASPRLLDVLITAKNHDVKNDLFSSAPAPEHWAYALITLQTMEGFLGRGNYGIARMNGGFASRPEIAIAPNLGSGARFRRDLKVFLGLRESLESRWLRDFGSVGDVALSWTVPWGGGKTESLGLRQVDPYFLEVCRRVRLTTGESQNIVARIAPTQGARMATKELLGNLGDPWTPVRVKDGAALTVSETGFHYRLAQEVLFSDDYASPPALERRDDETGDQLAVLRVLARGQGKTGGFHERYLHIPGKLMGRWSQQESRQRWGKETQARVKLAADVRLKVLKVALLALVQSRVAEAEGQRLNFKDDHADPWLSRFDRAVDRIFFEDFFADLNADLPAEERELRWEQRLWDLAEEIFEPACTSLAPNSVHRYRALVSARGRFHGIRRKILARAAAARSNPPPTDSSTTTSPARPGEGAEA